MQNRSGAIAQPAGHSLHQCGRTAIYVGRSDDHLGLVVEDKTL
jgi:hypothetical protein